MRNNKNVIAKVILFIILFLGVIFELANHFHLTYIFVNSKLGTLMPQKWILIISFLGAMFFVCSIVGLGIIGYRAGSWAMALLTVGVSYMSYALIPASINTDVMQIATLEYAVVLPLIVAFTTHELSKFLGLKEITTLTQEQEIQLEGIRRTQEFERRQNALSPAPTLPVQQNATVQNSAKVIPVQNATVPIQNATVPEQPENAYIKLINDAINKPKNGTHYPTNLRSRYKEKKNDYRNESVPKSNLGFQFRNGLVPKTHENPENPQNASVLHDLRIKQVYVGTIVKCEIHECENEFIKKNITHRFCSAKCRKVSYDREGGQKV